METENKSYSYFVTALKCKLDDNYAGKPTLLAEATGLSVGYIKDILAGNKTAGYKAQTKIAGAFDMELASFLTLGYRIENGGIKAEFPEITYITKVAAKPAAGFGSFETSSGSEDVFAFRSEWIYQKGDPANLVLMDVVGDSMYPYIMDNDTVMIDKSKTALFPNKVYAVRVEDLIYLKYIDREPGKFILRSHNRDYDPIHIDTQFLTENSFAILGRVVWWAHDELGE